MTSIASRMSAPFFVPESGNICTKSIEAFKAIVERVGVGVKVESYPASTLFKQGTEVPALQRGNLEMSTMTTFEVAQQIPELGFLNRGYLFRDYDHMRHVIDGPLTRTATAIFTRWPRSTPSLSR